MKKQNKFKVGDYVKCISEKKYAFTTKDVICKVVGFEKKGNEDMQVVVVDMSKSKHVPIVALMISGISGEDAKKEYPFNQSKFDVEAKFFAKTKYSPKKNSAKKPVKKVSKKVVRKSK